MINLGHAIFQAARKTTGILPSSDQAAALWGVGPGKAGEIITADSALTLSFVFNAVDIISNAMMMPLFTYKSLAGQGKEAQRDHPVFKLLHRRPNPEMRAAAFKKLLHVWKLLWGDGRAEIEWNGARTVPLNLWPIHPNRSWTRRDDDGNKVHEVLNEDGTIITLADRDVIHIKGLSLDGLNGLSRVAMGNESLGLAKAQESMAARFFGNNAMPGMAVTHPKRLTPDAKENMRKTWRETYGQDGQGGVVILEEGVSVEQFHMPNNEAQFLESRVHSILEGCRWFNISPHKLKELSRATFSNIVNLALEFIGDTIMPHAIEAETEFTGKLFSEAEQDDGMFVEYNLDGLLRADIVARNKSLEIERRNGIINADRWLSLQNEPPLPSGKGEDFWQPTNMKVVTEGPGPKVPAIPEQAVKSILAGHADMLNDAIGRVHKNAGLAIARAERLRKQPPDPLKFQAQFVEAITPIMDSLAKCFVQVRPDIEFQCRSIIVSAAKTFLSSGPGDPAVEAGVIIDQVREAVK